MRNASEGLQIARKTLRFLTAAIFWLHALFILPIPMPSAARWAARFHVDPSEAVIILVLVFVTILSGYGFTKFGLDLAYIYIFPFVALYHCVRVSIAAVALIYRTFHGTSAVPAAPSASPQPVRAARELPLDTQVAWNWKGLVSSTLRPFRQFVLLWCLLLLLTSVKILAWVALIVLLFQLFRALVKVVVLVVLSAKWLASIEEQVRKSLQNMLDELLTIPEDAELTREWKMLVSKVLGIRTLIQLLQNRNAISFSFLALSLCVFAVLHVYFAFLFSFVYFGLARVQSIPYSWADALMVSVFIPFEITMLPRNAWMQFASGIHCLFVVSLGFGTLFAYIQRKLDAVYSAFEEVHLRLQAIEVRSKLDKLSAKLNPAAPLQPLPSPANSPAGPPSPPGHPSEARRSGTLSHS